MKRNSNRAHPHRRLFISFVLILFIGAAYTLGWSPAFSVKRVIVVGAPTNSENEAIRTSVKLGDKLARIEPRALRETLHNFAWLGRSTVTRNWFNGTVTIRVWTRIPVARADGELVDSGGHMFTLPGQESLELPLIQATSSVARTFAVSLLNILPTEVRTSLISITADGSHSARLSTQMNIDGIPRPITIIWGDQKNTELKGRVLKALLALPENLEVKVVDVSAPHAPIVK